MASFFGKLKSNSDARNSAASSPAKQKVDPNAPQSTPLERMLQNAGPLRNDGSDKFWGMENFGNTCYCNSMLQCLYYSAPFREHVLAYPQRSSPDSISTAATRAIPRPKPQANGPAKLGPNPANRNGQPLANGQQRPEDKESPEYKKKQALLAGPILNMSYQNSANYDMPDSLYSTLKDIFEAVVLNHSRNGIVSPSRLVEVLRRDNEMFRGQLHQDAHEFFNLLLNTAIDNIDEHEKKIVERRLAAKQVEQDATGSSPKRNGELGSGTVSFPSTLPLAEPAPSKWLRDMFEGVLQSETRCLTCENTSTRDEPFLDLSVDLEQFNSVTSCLRRFSEEEMLCERNKFHCDGCGGLVEAEKRFQIQKLPKVLALHLKRFKYTEDLARLQKLFHKVVYPFHLRLFNTTNDAEDPDRLYELYAVVVHVGGGPYHGHYVAVIKTQDRGWLLFDDEMVEPVDRSYVQNFFGDKPGLATAYVLFYQETTEEAIRAEQEREGKRRASEIHADAATVKTRDSAELHRVHTSVSPITSPTDPFTSLEHSLTAPQPQTNGQIEPLRHPTSPGLLPTSFLLQSKKEKVKEEKERKAAEKAARKEKEREDEEARAVSNHNDEPPSTNGITTLGGLDRFRRSKSLRFGSLGKKDKKNLVSDDGLLNSAIDDTPERDKQRDGATATAPSKDNQKEKDKDKAQDKDAKEKKTRFSIRKKSFGMLS